MAHNYVYEDVSVATVRCKLYQRHSLENSLLKHFRGSVVFKRNELYACFRFLHNSVICIGGIQPLCSNPQCSRHTVISESVFETAVILPGTHADGMWMVLLSRNQITVFNVSFHKFPFVFPHEVCFSRNSLSFTVNLLINFQTKQFAKLCGGFHFMPFYDIVSFLQFSHSFFFLYPKIDYIFLIAVAFVKWLSDIHPNYKMVYGMVKDHTYCKTIVSSHSKMFGETSLPWSPSKPDPFEAFAKQNFCRFCNPHAEKAISVVQFFFQMCTVFQSILFSSVANSHLLLVRLLCKLFIVLFGMPPYLSDKQSYCQFVPTKCIFCKLCEKQKYKQYRRIKLGLKSNVKENSLRTEGHHSAMPTAPSFPPCTGFQTASGRSVSVNQWHLKNVKMKLSSLLNVPSQVNRKFNLPILGNQGQAKPLESAVNSVTGLFLPSISPMALIQNSYATTVIRAQKTEGILEKEQRAACSRSILQAGMVTDQIQESRMSTGSDDSSRNIFSEAEIPKEETSTLPRSFGFQTASGKTVQICPQQLSEVRKKLNEVFLPSLSCNPGLSPDPLCDKQCVSSLSQNESSSVWREKIDKVFKVCGRQYNNLCSTVSHDSSEWDKSKVSELLHHSYTSAGEFVNSEFLNKDKGMIFSAKEGTVGNAFQDVKNSRNNIEIQKILDRDIKCYREQNMAEMCKSIFQTASGKSVDVDPFAVVLARKKLHVGQNFMSPELNFSIEVPSLNAKSSLPGSKCPDDGVQVLDQKEVAKMGLFKEPSTYEIFSEGQISFPEKMLDLFGPKICIEIPAKKTGGEVNSLLETECVPCAHCPAPCSVSVEARCIANSQPTFFVEQKMSKCTNDETASSSLQAEQCAKQDAHKALTVAEMFDFSVVKIPLQINLVITVNFVKQDESYTCVSEIPGDDFWNNGSNLQGWETCLSSDANKVSLHDMSSFQVHEAFCSSVSVSLSEWMSLLCLLESDSISNILHNFLDTEGTSWKCKRYSQINSICDCLNCMEYSHSFIKNPDNQCDGNCPSLNCVNVFKCEEDAGSSESSCAIERNGICHCCFKASTSLFLTVFSTDEVIHDVQCHDSSYSSKGFLWKMKQDHPDKRLHLKNISENFPKNITDELSSYGLNSSVLQMTPSTAAKFVFNETYFASRERGSDGQIILSGDTTALYLDEQGRAGPEELYRALVACPGIESRHATEQWFINHYRFIIWKLAALETSFPSEVGNRCLTPDFVVQQLRYRYDCEIGEGKRSALRKIMEHDANPGQPLVLFVSALIPASDGSDSFSELKLSDGWYEIDAETDRAMELQIRKGRLRQGTKLITAGAQLTGCDTPCHPLEAGHNAKLKIHTNSTRRCKWYLKLGFYEKPQDYVMAISSLHPCGGNVTCVEGVIVHVYPVLYFEKYPDGRSSYHTERQEREFSEKHESLKQEKLQILSEKVKAELTSRDMCAEDTVCETLDASVTPDHLRRLEVYKERFEKLLNASVSRAKENGEFPVERKVLRVKKFQLQGVHKDDVENPAGSVLVTIWMEPSEESDFLPEGCLVRVHNARSRRGKYGSVQLQVYGMFRLEVIGKETDASALTACYKAKRTVAFRNIESAVRISDLPTIDILGMIFKKSQDGFPDYVYITDRECNVLAIRFNGVTINDYQFVLEIGAVIVGYNLTPVACVHSSMPEVEATPLSVFTQNPKEEFLKAAITNLKKNLADVPVEFLIRKAKRVLNHGSSLKRCFAEAFSSAGGHKNKKGKAVRFPSYVPVVPDGEGRKSVHSEQSLDLNK